MTNSKTSLNPSLYFVLIALAIALVIAFVWSLATGAVTIPFAEVTHVILNKLGLTNFYLDENSDLVINELRMPRALLAMCVGAGLSVAGASLQGLFRNPLTDPALIGLSSGATLGAVGVIVLGGAFFHLVDTTLREYLMEVAAFTGGAISTFASYRLATRGGQTSVSMLLLSGIAINALAGAIYGVLLFMATDSQLRSISFWQLGSMAGATWQNLTATVVFLIPSTLALLAFGNKLNLLALGEKEAYYLGVNVQSFKKYLVILICIAVGAAVANCGIIAFMGLLVPHIIRLIVGHNYKAILPCSLLGGALLLLIADTLARTIIAPAEIPIGIITTGLGGPFFLWLLLKGRKEEQL